MPDSYADVLVKKMRADVESDWPDRLLRSLAFASLYDEWDVQRGRLPLTDTGLTQREKDVLQAFSVGLTVKMVAQILGISINTVKHHEKRASAKLKAKNVTHACCLAIGHGYIVGPPQ